MLTVKEVARSDQPERLYTVETVEFNKKPPLRGRTRLLDPM